MSSRLNCMILFNFLAPALRRNRLELSRTDKKSEKFKAWMLVQIRNSSAPGCTRRWYNEHLNEQLSQVPTSLSGSNNKLFMIGPRDLAPSMCPQSVVPFMGSYRYQASYPTTVFPVAMIPNRVLRDLRNDVHRSRIEPRTLR